MSMKNIGHWMKTRDKNGLKFSSQKRFDPNFSADLMSLIKKYDPNIKDIAWNEYPSISEQLKLHDNAIEKIKDGDAEKIVMLSNDVNTFLGKYGFGHEWWLDLLTVILIGKFAPPFINFERRDEGKRVVLVLNPDTSLEDIKNNFDIIKTSQKSLWPDFHKSNASAKSSKQLNELAMLEAIKETELDFSNKEKLSTYESAVYDQERKTGKTMKEIERKINAILANRRLQGERALNISLKKKITDLEATRFLVGDDPKKVKMKVNQLRQAKRRVRRKK